MKHILIMEDDIALALDWKNAFELNGYDVTLSSDGGEAEALLKKNEYDLVITDLFVKLRVSSKRRAKTPKRVKTRR